MAGVMDASVPFAPGLHILMDLFGGKACADQADLRTAMIGAASAAGAKVLSCHLHRFGDTGGVTGVALLADSHISIHTWPERDYAAVDIFMCGRADARAAAAYLQAALAPVRADVTEIARAQGNQAAHPSR
jgi:S-adenosylmethionine decarboxylase